MKKKVNVLIIFTVIILSASILSGCHAYKLFDKNNSYREGDRIWIEGRVTSIDDSTLDSEYTYYAVELKANDGTVWDVFIDDATIQDEMKSYSTIIAFGEYRVPYEFSNGDISYNIFPDVVKLDGKKYKVKRGYR
jgi:hypothetical protein